MPFTRKLQQAMLANQTGVEPSLGPLSRFPAAGQLDVYAAASIASVVEITVLVGTDIVADRALVNINEIAGRLKIPDDLVASGRGNPNDPITIRLDNTAGGTPNVELLVAIS